MSSNSDASWMPNGRHKFNIGSSLGTMLRARKGAQSRRNNNLPVRDFYSLRYSFKPNNVDTSKTGSIEVTKKTDTTTVVLEHPSTQPGEAYSFLGTENSAKETECLLIYDEQLGSFTLEKIDSYVTLHSHKKVAPTLPASEPSPSVTPPPKQAPPPPRSPPRVAVAEPVDDDLGADFDAELALLDEPAPAPLQPPAPTFDLEVFEDPVSLPPPPPPPSQPKKKKVALPGKPKRPTAPAPAPTPTPAPPPPPTLSSGLEEENLEFGWPIAPPPTTKDPPTKKRRLSDEGLALPGSSNSSSFVQPLPAYQPQPKSLADMADEEEEEEDEWDEVEPGANQDDGLFGEGEEIDLDDFDNEMEQVLDDDPEDGVPPSQDDMGVGGGGGGGVIPSLNDLADDDDDFSSSEDSEDE